MSKQLLIDAAPIKLSLQESEGGKMVARGEFARCDVPTQNGRTYPRGVYEREIKKLQESVGSRRAFGELDHPDDGKTKLSRVSHLITKLTVDKNGVVIGEAEILDTPNGRTLKAILDSGAEVGVSSRGFGSTRAMPDGSSMVGEDFVLRSFDFVADPAMKTAYPQIFAEDVEVDAEQDLLAEFPELAEDLRSREREAARRDAEAAVGTMISANEEKVRSEMREAFEKQLAEAIVGVRESVTEGLREEFSSDPEIGGARAVLGKIASLVGTFSGSGHSDEVALRDAVRERDLQIASMKESLDKATDIARRASYALVVEQRIGGHPMGERIRKVLGDISAFGSRDALQNRLEDIAGEYDEIVSERQQRVDENHASEVESLRNRIAELEASFEEASSQIEAFETADEEAQERFESKIDALVQKHKAELDEARSAVSEALETAKQYRSLAESKDAEAKSSDLTAYKARKTSGLTNASRLMKMIESIDDKDAVDAIIDESGTNDISDRDLSEAVRKLKRGRVSTGAMTEEVAPNILRDPMLGGVTNAQFLELSGIKRAR
jgi:polyhydroxyalkanoate synthesis regulator phasin